MKIVTSKQANKGFSLIELMIAVTIISILAAVGYPSYTQYVIRGKRSEARSALLDAAARQERFYSDNNRYTTAIGSGGLAITEATNCTATGVQTETCKYTLTAAFTTDNQDFTITAAPTFPDTECDNLSIDQTGLKTENGTSDVSTCWGK